MNAKVIKLKGQRFEGKDKLGYYMPNTHVIKVDNGLISFDGVVPYSPKGGRKTLLLLVNEVEWLATMKVVKPMEVII